MDNNWSQYYIFHTVAENKNISYAAKKLYISQPAISKAIHKLEANLDTQLLKRSSRGVSLTESGNILYEATKQAFTCLLEAENKIIAIKKMEIGQIRIGVSTTLCKYLLLPKLEKFMDNYPNVKITITCQSTIHTVKLLEENKVDIGFIGNIKKKRDIKFYPSCSIQDIFVTSPVYLERFKKGCSMERLQLDKEVFENANIMLLEAENISRKYVEEYFKEYEITINQILEVGAMDLLIEFAKMGLGIACVIKEFVKEELDQGVLIQIPLEIEMKQREIGFAYCENIAMTQAVEQFLEEVRLEEDEKFNLEKGNNFNGVGTTMQCKKE